MDFTFTEEQELLRRSVREFARSEIGPLVIYLASSASDYVNGYTVAVDGGWLAR